MAFQPGHAIAGKRPAEFVQQARFAEPGFADQCDRLALAGFGAGQPLVQLAQLALAADQHGQPLLGSDLQPVAPGRPPGDLVHDHRLALALDLDRAERLGAHLAGRRPVGILGDHDRARLGERLHARGQVHDVAVGGVIHPQIVADPPDHHRPGVQTDPQPHRHAVLVLDLAVVAADRLLDRQRRVHRPHRMVLERDRRAEQRHHAIAEIAVDGPFVAMHRVGGQLQHPVHQQVQLFRVEFLRQRRGIGNIGKQNGDELAFAFERAARGQDLFRQIPRRIGLRRPRLAGLRRLLPGGVRRRAEAAAAFVAELRQRPIDLAAAVAANRQGCAAFVAEAGLLPVLMLAREALHAFAPWRPQRSDQASPETKAIIGGLRQISLIF